MIIYAAFLDVYTGGQGGLDCDVLADVDVQAISEIPISLPRTPPILNIENQNCRCTDIPTQN